ncbi:Uncharacterised protein [BD1-7 clade bacterium]|uniref:Uncharacterized protein n=1 Tax=BD1-7 clade bacterium TaxID=2029982 RepID=A0A5S9PB21_9GAMM|nr:Uncharacterised protein [BD1-7 clade bacterium]
MLPANSSPVVDAGDNTGCGTGLGIEIDQRGELRADGACDLGAVEIQYNAPPPPPPEPEVQLGATKGVFLMLLAGLYGFRRTFNRA